MELKAKIMKLGQNFLQSKRISAQIANVAKLKPDDIVLEIGPGKGILTEKILERAKKVIAVEKDKALVELLKEKFTEEIKSGKLKLIHDDILKFNPTSYALNAKRYKVVANIPYYITSRILRVFLESDAWPESMILMVQREVAERIVAKPPHMNVLALSVQVYGTPKIEFKVSKKHFSPKPKVDSAVITISDISRDFFTNPDRGGDSNVAGNEISEKDFFHLIKTGFAQKRKMLINNLKNLKEGSLEPKKILEKCKIQPKARAENLSINDWVCVYEMLVD